MGPVRAGTGQHAITPSWLTIGGRVGPVSTPAAAQDGGRSTAILIGEPLPSLPISPASDFRPWERSVWAAGKTSASAQEALRRADVRGAISSEMLKRHPGNASAKEGVRYVKLDGIKLAGIPANLG